MSNEKHACEKAMWQRGQRHRCSKSATINENGRWYCGTHAPSKVTERDKARNEKREAKHARRNAVRAAYDALKRAEQAIVTRYVGSFEDGLTIDYRKAKARIEELAAKGDAE